MSIKERKIREVGNSVVITISKDFLQQKGLNPGDVVYVDEMKLQAAITKKVSHSNEIDLAVSQVLSEHNETFKALVDK